MVDTRGNELHVGDTVAYVKGKNSSARLEVGVVTKIYPNKGVGGGEACSVDNHAHILPFRVLKI